MPVLGGFGLAVPITAAPLRSIKRRRQLPGERLFYYNTDWWKHKTDPPGEALPRFAALCEILPKTQAYNRQPSGIAI